MRLVFFSLTFLAFWSLLAAGEPWPYNRYNPSERDGRLGRSPHTLPQDDLLPEDLFVNWFRGQVNSNSSDAVQLQRIFKNGTIPDSVSSTEELLELIKVPDESATPDLYSQLPVFYMDRDSRSEANELFKNLDYEVDPRCTISRSSWWYRTYEGNCNWLKQYETDIGSVGTAKQRDYRQYNYTDKVSEPRGGPNPRAVSNAFFKRKKRLYYDHTPLLLGLIEFIMHDITYSEDSQEYIDVAMPADEQSFPLNTTLRVYRTAAAPGTGTSKSNSRENINKASTWLDISSLYGSTPDVAHRLRSHKGGKLLTQEVRAPGTKKKASYLPFNTMGVPTNTQPDVSADQLFAGGDPRTNEDWLMLGVHTLLLRDHNRLCDKLTKEKPDWGDEEIYQTVRLLMGAKYALMANAYQMTYWTDEMPWPRDDGFPLYRKMFGQDALNINPANTYPWPLVTKYGKPMTTSAEMAIVYRFHEFIIPSFPINDQNNNTLWEQDLFDTGFNATGFLAVGLEGILRGTIASSIPNFKSGVDEKFRTAGRYRGRPLDIVVASIVHEREQGLPTFNQYFRAYNSEGPKVEVPIRDTWGSFSSDPEVVADLQRLYSHPDEVDLVVGCQLDEESFPGTTVPKSALIISLFSLFGMGNSDRFSVGFSMMRCFLVDTPFNCNPSNALEDIIWKQTQLPVLGIPVRFYDNVWLKELDIQAHGVNLLWRLITENSEIECVQQYPLLPFNEKTDPILCEGKDTKPGWLELFLTAFQIFLKRIKDKFNSALKNPWSALQQVTIYVVIPILVTIWIWRWLRPVPEAPPSLRGLPIIGEALAFRKNSLEVLRRGFRDFGDSSSRCFGIPLASLTHYVLTSRKDLEMMKKDNEYEAKFSLHKFLGAINFSLITKKENFESDLHTKLIRQHFADPKTLAEFSEPITEATQDFLRERPLSTGEPTKHTSLNDWINELIASVVSRCIVGPEGYSNSELIETFLKFNDDAVQAMGMSGLLPRFLQFIAARNINKDFLTVRKVTLPIIKQRRQAGRGLKEAPVFMDYILEAVDDDERVSDLIVIVVWGGLVNLQATFSSALLDIINDPSGQSTLLPGLKDADCSNLDTFRPWEEVSPWNPLRSAMFESIRLSGPITGPARIVLEKTSLPSQPSLKLPRGSIATLSSYSSHRDGAAWGPDAAAYRPRRFLTSEPPVGQPDFITWGLSGPHMCPGRWFGQAAIMLMTKAVLEEYEFDQAERLSDDKKYVYSAGNVTRVPVEVTVQRRTKG